MTTRVRVVCTNRGRHREIAFQDLTISETGRIVGPDVEVAADGRLTWRWRCRRCGRDTQVSDTRYPDLGARLVKLRHAGMLEQLDISALPF